MMSTIKGALRHLVLCLIVFLTVFTGQSATAQEWTVSEVTPVWSNTDTWTPPIDPDDPHPADTYEPATAATDGVAYDRNDFLSGTNQRTGIGSGGTAKFRTEARPTFTARADPILCRGTFPCGHDHTFFGPDDPYVIANVENFDYEMGRAYASSNSQGDTLNATNYWEPSIKDCRYGPCLTIIPKSATFYYTLDVALGQNATRLRRDFNFIGGANPTNYNDTAFRAELSAASLQYPGTVDTPAGVAGIACYLGDGTSVTSPVTVVGDQHKMRVSATGGYDDTRARYLKGPNGEDPWDGGCTAGYLVLEIGAPGCWDATNLHSPSGRDHVTYAARDEDNAPSQQCPLNYVAVPHFIVKVFVYHNGWNEDLQYWYMSSDRMRMATTECPDATSPCDGVSGGNTPATVDGVYYSRVSKSPCRSTGLDFCPFETSHFDWWGAWDYETMTDWMRNCIGMVVDGVDGTYADCGSGGLDTNKSLQGMGPTNVDTASESVEGQRYFKINPADENQGPLVLEVHDH